MGFIKYNANPVHKRVGDCTVRAISKALNQEWEKTYTDIALMGFMLCDMPSANHVWGSYLRHKGFSCSVIPNNSFDSYTVSDFAEDNPQGTYILAISGHVVCVIDGDWYDTWNSAEEIPLYYWKREGN